MFERIGFSGWLVFCSLYVLACGEPGVDMSERPTGSFAALIGISQLAHDVTSVRFDVVAADVACGATPLASQTVPLDGDLLPGSSQRFADAFFVLAPGTYRVCAAPLAAAGASLECGASDGVASIIAGQTSDLVLVSQCTGAAGAGLGTVLTLNDPPVIGAVTLDPAQQVSTCESVSIVASASDPNDDALTYAFVLQPGPVGGQLTQTGAQARFWGPAGDYVVEIQVTDTHGASALLSVPIHVVAATCAVPAAVQAIFAARCSPCHITGSSGGLHLDPASASYTNLVNRPVRPAACATQVLVVPQNPASSYLIAKLRGTLGICGTPMPRNAPPLPEEEIATIEAWIAALPIAPLPSPAPLL